MPTIDFLPEHYRQRRKQSRVRWWWALVVCLFGGVVVGTSSLQWLNVLRIKGELTRLETQVATVRQLDQNLLELETKVAALSHHANLYTFLAHPWPRTQILAAVVQPLPNEMQLSSIRIAESLIAKSAPVSAPAPETASPPTSPPQPAVADLQKLHDAQESQRLVVVVEGTAQEVEHLHTYLDALGRHPLIAEARLNTLETRKVETIPPAAGNPEMQSLGNPRPIIENRTSKNSTTRSLVVFQVQITVKSGHGLSDGPSGPLTPATAAKTAKLNPEPLR